MAERSPLHTPLCDELGAQHAIFGFTHSLDAAIAISKNGGIGIWGATRSTPEEIEVGLTRMDAELGDLPYGIDLVIPPGMPEKDNRDEIEAAIPDEHRAFVNELRERFDVPDDGEPGMRSRFVRSEDVARKQVDVAMDSNLKVLALGIGSPEWVIGPAKQRGMKMISLVGQPKHAEKALRAGADMLVAQGYDAGAHTGTVGTFSLVPRIVDMAGDAPVIAAGGVATGRHIAASLAMGAQGVWLRQRVRGDRRLEGRRHGRSRRRDGRHHRPTHRQSLMPSPTAGLFEGLRVLELGQYVAAPYAAELFAHGGADVIKVEPVAGDATRYNSPLGRDEGRQYIVKARGKRGIPVDLGTEAGRTVARDLAVSSDVVITNMRPGVDVRLGLDFDSLIAENPSLVFGQISGFGDQGPLASRPSVDMIAQSWSGLNVSVGAGHDGRPRHNEAFLCDYTAGLLLAFGVASALRSVALGQPGQKVTTSLAHAALVLQHRNANVFEGIDDWKADVAGWVDELGLEGALAKRSEQGLLDAFFFTSYATADEPEIPHQPSASTPTRSCATSGTTTPPSSASSPMASSAANPEELGRVRPTSRDRR